MIQKGPASHLKSWFVFLFFALIGTFLFEKLVIIFLPIPGIFLILHDKKWVWGIGGITLLSALFLVLGVTHPSLWILILTYTLITIILFIGLDQGWNPQKNIIRGTLVGILVFLIGFGLFILGAEQAWKHQPVNQIESFVSIWLKKNEEGLSDYRKLKGVEGQLDWIRQNREEIVTTFVQILPSILFGIVFFSLFLDFYIIQYFWFQSKDQLGQRFMIEEWKIHDLCPWLVVLTLGFILIRIPQFQIIAWNLLLAMVVIYLTQGIGVFLFFVNRMKMGSLGKVMILLLSFLIIYFYPILILLGFFDTWIDFRKLRPKPVNTD